MRFAQEDFGRIRMQLAIYTSIFRRCTKNELKGAFVTRFVFAITAAGVVSCGGRKTSPLTPFILHIVFSLSPLR